MIKLVAGKPSVNEFPPCFLFIAKKAYWPLPLFLEVCEYVAVAAMKTKAALLIDKLNAIASNYVRPVSPGQRGQSPANTVYVARTTVSLTRTRTRLTGGVAYFARVLELAAIKTVLRKTT
jgi:hypothetical protein